MQNLNEDLAAQVAQLKALNAELEAFTYSVSHDLRAPLRSIEGFSQALFEDYTEVLDEQGKEYIRRIQAASRRMNALIEDLLKLSRIGRASIVAEEVDLTAIAADVANDLAVLFPSHPVQITMEPGIKAWGDSRLLRIVLENLMNNAWKFTSKTKEPKVNFRQSKLNGHLTYVISDNGAGFDPSTAGNLFAPFQRLHPASEFPGNGIGLAIVQRIVHKHGGQISAEGTPGQGATFCFRLAARGREK